MTAASQRWQLEGDSAELYERYLVPPVALPWARDLVERVGVKLGDQVLDVACGTGAVARVAAERAGNDGRVVGLDVNRAMLSVARARHPELEWHQASVIELPFVDDEFDVVLCQLGLQFFADRLASLGEMRRVLAPGGRCGASVYSSIERNPAAAALASSLDRHFGEGASYAKRDEHSLADRSELAALLGTAGFARVRVDTITREVRFPSAQEWVRIQFAATPLAALLKGCEPSEREGLLARVGGDVEAALPQHADGADFVFPQEVHIAVATRGRVDEST